MSLFRKSAAGSPSGSTTAPATSGATGSGRLVLTFTATDRPDAEASFESGLPPEGHALTISYPHLVVEMVLGNDGEALVDVFLPEPSLLLRRLPEFPKRVGALGLTDEAMAILAKINDQRSAQEIADPSPHVHSS